MKRIAQIWTRVRELGFGAGRHSRSPAIRPAPEPISPPARDVETPDAGASRQPSPVVPAAMMMSMPFDAMKSGFEVTRLAVESQAVVTMRLMGMGGAWNTPFDESYRMWREKPAAFTEATGRGMEAAMKGQPPSAVVSAMVAPLSRDAARNRDRLAQRGLRKPG